MVFPVGSGLTGNQQVQAYKALAPKSPFASGIQSLKPKNIGPQYTPKSGLNTQVDGFTYTKDGWQPGTQNYSPFPKSQSSSTDIKPSPSYSGNTVAQSGNSASQGVGSGSNPTVAAKNTMPGTGYGGIIPGNEPAATAGELVSGASFDYNLTPEQRAYEEALREQAAYNQKQSKLNVNPESIYQDTLAQFQGEIDAANQIYAQKLAEAKMQGQSRLGTTRAENFNAGAVNSSFGNAAQERTQQYNAGIESGIQAEKLKTIASIENTARELGNRYYEQKKAAKEAGLESYVTSLKNISAAKDAIAQSVADSMIQSNVKLEEVTPSQFDSIAKKAGVSVNQVKSAYAARQEELAAAALKGQFNLSEGQARYDAQGNLIASRAKTYKGGSGTGGVSGVSDAALNFAKQIQSGAATLANVPSAMRAEVATALMQLPSTKIQELDTVTNLIDELYSNPELDNITGPIDQVAGGLFGQAAVAKNLYNQLQGVLALEGRSKLKGSGAISDFEFRVLKDAQSALGRNLPASAMRAELLKIKNILENRKQTLLSQGFVGSEDVTIDETQIDETNPPEQVTMPDGTILTLQPDGTYE